MKDEVLSISHWKVQQRLREARAREARNGKLATFGTLIASSPVLSKLQKELNARTREVSQERGAPRTPRPGNESPGGSGTIAGVAKTERHLASTQTRAGSTPAVRSTPNAETAG